MRVAMIMDEQRLRQEQRLLNRLGVGLMAEGFSLTRIVPESMVRETIDQSEQRIALARRIETPMRVAPWLRRSSRQRVIERIGEQVPDVLYLCGRDTWRLGLDIAQAMDRPALLEIWTAELISAALDMRHQSSIGGVVAASAAIAADLRQLGSVQVFEAHVGVATAAASHQSWSETGRAPSIVALGSARDVIGYGALLTGLSTIASKYAGLNMLMELDGPHEHDIWRSAERLGLLGIVSAIGSAAKHRDLVLHADIVVWPERSGAVRSLLLECMSMGQAVVARDDPALDMLIEGETALVIHDSSAETWAKRLDEVLANPQATRAIGLRGRDHVARYHRSVDQVAGLAKALESLAAANPMVFPSKRGG